MYLHIGKDFIVAKGSIVAVCDLDNTTGSGITREYLARAERAGRVINAAEDIPKSFVICVREGRETVYLSQLSPQTLLRRCGAAEII